MTAGAKGEMEVTEEGKYCQAEKFNSRKQRKSLASLSQLSVFKLGLPTAPVLNSVLLLILIKQ